MHVSWGYHSPDADNLWRDAFGRTLALQRLEVEGTRDICPWLALPEAIDFQAALGHDAVRARMRELAAHVRECLTGWCGLVPLTPEHPELHCGMTAFFLPVGTDPAWLRRQLWERYRIEISVTASADRPPLRVSTRFFNTEIEAERLREALGELTSEGSRWT
jgi:isopenicillin-N epimerase